MVNSERNLTPGPRRGRPARRGAAGLADHRPGRLRDGVRGRVHLRLRRGGLRGDQAGLEPGRPAATCAASPTSGCAPRPCSGPRPPDGRRPQPDPLPQRRREPAPAGATRTAPGRGWPSPPPSGRAVFFARPHLPAAELPDDDYPFLLNTGRLQHQWHTLTKTGKVAKLNKLNPGPFVEIHPDDAAAARHRRRATRWRSPPGAAGRCCPAVVTDRVRPGDCFAPFHWNDLFGEYLSVNARHQRRRRPDLLPARVQGLRGHPDQGRRARPAADRDTPAGAPDRPGRCRAAPGRPSRPPIGIADRAAALPAVRRLLGRVPAYRRRVLAARRPAGRPGAAGPRRVAGARSTMVDGVLAGAVRPYRRAGSAARGAGLPAGAGRPGRPDPAGGRAVGLADRQRRGARRRRSPTGWPSAGRPVALHGMAECAPAVLARGTDLLVVTSTFGDGERARQRHRLLAGARAGADAAALDRRALRRAGPRRLQLRRLLRPRPPPRRAARRARARPGWWPRRTANRTTSEAAGRWLDAGRRPSSARPDAADRPAGTGRRAGPRHGPTVRRTSPTGHRPAGRQPPAQPARRRQGGPPRSPSTVADDRLAYEAGDALGRAAAQLPRPGRRSGWRSPGWTGDAEVELGGHGPLPFGEALRDHLDITAITPDLLRFVADRTGDDGAAATCCAPTTRTSSPRGCGAGRPSTCSPSTRSAPRRRSGPDLLKRLQPRLYSISSSPLADPDAVQLTVSVVRYERPRGARRKGVCSTLPRRRARPAARCRCFVQRSPHFRPPADPDAPMIMVGPGTGIAPFIGFLDERRARGPPRRQLAVLRRAARRPPTSTTATSSTSCAHEGVLTRLDLAFSRDQRGQGLRPGPDARARRPAVVLARRTAPTSTSAATPPGWPRTSTGRCATSSLAHGGLDEEAAAAYVRQLAAEKRYVRDVY